MRQEVSENDNGKVQVLVACMQQKDDSLYKQMNLQTDAVLANQCDTFGYQEYSEPDGSRVVLFSTTDRGVGKNRNKALMIATGEYLLCADQDMVYVNGYQRIVENAFRECPKADIVVFRLEYLNRFTPARTENESFSRVHIWNAMRYGTARIAIRRSSLEKACISFSHLYGGGAPHSAGEDTLFLRDALRKGLKMYTCPVVIAKVKQEESSWFKGYTDKYFIDKGILIANAFPMMKLFMAVYYSFRLKDISKDYNFRTILGLMLRGVKEYENI